MVGSVNNTIGFEKNGESTVRTSHATYNIIYGLVVSRSIVYMRLTILYCGLSAPAISKYSAFRSDDFSFHFRLFFSTPEMFPTIYGHCDPQTSRSIRRRNIAARNDYTRCAP